MSDTYEFLKAQKDAIIEKQRSLVEKRALNAERALRIIAAWHFEGTDSILECQDLARKTLADNAGWSALHSQPREEGKAK